MWFLGEWLFTTKRVGWLAVTWRQSAAYQHRIASWVMEQYPTSRHFVSHFPVSFPGEPLAIFGDTAFRSPIEFGVKLSNIGNNPK